MEIVSSAVRGWEKRCLLDRECHYKVPCQGDDRTCDRKAYDEDDEILSASEDYGLLILNTHSLDRESDKNRNYFSHNYRDTHKNTLTCPGKIRYPGYDRAGDSSHELFIRYLKQCVNNRALAGIQRFSEITDMDLYKRENVYSMNEGIRVLYVDDEPDLLDIAQLFLEQSGDFQVTTSTSARTALDSPTIRSYDLIISDYQMPELDGLAFLKEVRHRYGDIPFILFTGRGREEVVIEAINNGVDFYLQKGGDPTAQFAELAHKIRQAVTRRRAQDKLQAAYEQIAATEVELRSQYDELVVSDQRTLESERMFRELFDMIPLSCTVTDKDGHFILVNRSFEETTGYSSSEVMGKTSIELGFISENSEQKLLESLTATGRIDSKESIVKIRNGDERTIFVSSRSVTINAAPHIITAVFDITERKQAENALRESEERFRAIIDQSPFPVIVFNPAGDVVHFNEAHLRLWGVTREMAMRFNAFRDPQLETLGLLPAFRRAFAGEYLTIPPLEYDLPATMGEGQKKNVRGDFYPIRDAEGKVTHVILLHQDYTLFEQTPTTKSRVKDME